jgi:hypothetical protein
MVSESLLCFSPHSFPHLIITFRPARQTRLPWTDKSHENDRLWRVVNMGLPFELPEAAGDVTSHLAPPPLFEDLDSPLDLSGFDRFHRGLNDAR